MDARILEDAVRAIMSAEQAEIERMCEQMLVDPQGRGVRVDRVDGLLVSVRLDERVPWGVMHVHLHTSDWSDGTVEADLLRMYARILANNRYGAC